MKADKVLSMLGLAARAGQVESGEFCTERAVKGGYAECVIVASDSSDNTIKMFQNMCTYYEVPLYFYSDKGELGHAIGKEARASLALTDAGFAKQIEKRIAETKERD